MRIGLFTDTYVPNINGVVVSIKTLKEALEDLGHTVYVITNQPSISKTSYEDKILRLPGVELKFLYGYVMSSPIHLQAVSLIEEMDLDIIHAHSEFGVGLFARYLSNSLRIPLITTYHTTYEDYTHYVNFFKSDTIDSISKRAVEGLSKTFTRKSDIVIAPSEKTKEMLEGYGVENRIEVIPTGLDLERFKTDKTTKERIFDIKFECNIADDQTVFIYVGRLAKEKSVSVAIKAFKHLKDKGISAKFIIVGDGPDHKAYIKLVKELGLENEICFTGLKKSEEVPSYYHSSDAFISASTTETQGLTYIEALASGLGLFARQDEVLADLVIEDKTGFYFDDEKELADKLELFINDKGTKERIRENAIEKAQPYSLDEYYKHIIACYKAAIEMEKNVNNKRD